MNNTSYKRVRFQGLKVSEKNSGAHSGLVKLVVMTNVFFNNQQHKIKIKRFICVKQITSSFFITAEINVSIRSISKRENRPLKKTKFPAEFSSSASSVEVWE